jgi:hypothetical protein
MRHRHKCQAIRGLPRAAAAVLLLAALGAQGVGQAVGQAYGATAQPNGHKAHQASRHAPTQPQIACTVLGCMPIPAACHPVEGRTSGGIPTGFDVIVCPPGVWPLH